MINVGGQTVSGEGPPFIIAEAGSNHNGDLDTAKKMIETAAHADVDAVKFQIFRADRLYPKDDEAYEAFKSLEVPYSWIPTLKSLCEEQGIHFMASPFDEESADRLEPYVPAYKIASPLVTHYPLLKHISKKNKPMFVSTGAHDFSEICNTLDALIDWGATNIILLQCISAYPAPIHASNLRVIESFRDLEVLPGLSDHTTHPTIAPVVATALGATVIEKHFTLSKDLDGSDHAVSLEPNELKHMVSTVKRAYEALGSREKEVLEIERETYEKGRRCIFAAQQIERGEILDEQNIKILRPGNRESGIKPADYEEVLGQPAKQDIGKFQPLEWEYVEIDNKE